MGFKYNDQYDMRIERYYGLHSINGGKTARKLPAEYHGKKAVVVSASPGITVREAVSPEGKLWVRAEGYGSVVIAFQ